MAEQAAPLDPGDALELEMLQQQFNSFNISSVPAQRALDLLRAHSAAHAHAHAQAVAEAEARLEGNYNTALLELPPPVVQRVVKVCKHKPLFRQTVFDLKSSLWALEARLRSEEEGEQEGEQEEEYNDDTQAPSGIPASVFFELNKAMRRMKGPALRTGLETPEKLEVLDAALAAAAGVLFRSSVDNTLKLSEIFDAMQPSVFAHLSKENLGGILNSCKSLPEGWQPCPMFDDETMRSLRSVLLKHHSSACQTEPPAILTLALNNDLQEILKTARVPKQDWLTGGTEKLLEPCIEFLRGSIVEMYKSAIRVNLPFGNDQLGEVNVDIRVPIPLFFDHFNSELLVHGTKELHHATLANRESMKVLCAHRASQSPGVQEQASDLAGLPERAFKLDHLVVSKSEEAAAQLCFGTGETAYKDKVGSNKVRKDTRKCHDCAKAELYWVSISDADEHKALAEAMTTFSCICAGDSMVVYVYRRTESLVVCQVLFKYTVPSTREDFKSYIESETNFSGLIHGLLSTIQLKHLVEQQAQMFVDAKYKRAKKPKERAGVDDSKQESELGVDGYSPQKPSSRDKSKGKDGSRSGSKSGGASGKSPSEQVLAGLTNHNLMLDVKLLERDSYTSYVFLGTARQHGEKAFPVAIKYVPDSSFVAEAYCHQAAAALAPDGVLPLYAFTGDSEAILALKLPSVSQVPAGAGVLIMPRGMAWTPPASPLQFVKQMEGLGETVAKLGAAGLFHQDLRRYNVVVWQAKPHLIDFGFAAWRRDCLNVDVLQCRHHPMQAPELINWSSGAIGEAQVVFTLGSFLVEAISEYIEEELDWIRVDGRARQLLHRLARLKGTMECGFLPLELSSGIPLVLDVLHLLLSNASSRPSLKQAVEMMRELYVTWSKALEQSEAALVDLGPELSPAPEPEARLAQLCQHTKPFRVPLTNLNTVTAASSGP